MEEGRSMKRKNMGQSLIVKEEFVSMPVRGGSEIQISEYYSGRMD
jgi:hypothetical protein